MYKIGKSISKLSYNNILIGYDNRKSSPSLAKALADGIDNNIIYIIGYTTTPKLEYYSKVKKCIGVMITASHNESNYNGVKIFVDGKKIDNDVEELISFDIDDNDIYINYLMKHKIETKNKIVIDCANGPTAIACNKVYKDAIIYNNNLNDIINLNCGSTYPFNIINKVKENNADIGFSFDGDGDRVIAVSKNGNIIDGDYLCYILALYYKTLNLLNDRVVLTKLTNTGIIEAFNNKGIEVYLSDVGDKNVYKMMLDNNIILGSEASGHIINLSLDILGDGVLNSLVIVKALETLDLTLDDVYNEIKLVPSVLKNYYVDNMNIDLSGFSDVDIMVRKSGTENCYRVYLQCDDINRIEECINYIEEKMRT